MIVVHVRSAVFDLLSRMCGGHPINRMDWEILTDLLFPGHECMQQGFSCWTAIKGQMDKWRGSYSHSTYTCIVPFLSHQNGVTILTNLTAILQGGSSQIR